jgi:flagellar biosynthesis GTPase FlhF
MYERAKYAFKRASMGCSQIRKATPEAQILYIDRCFKYSEESREIRRKFPTSAQMSSSLVSLCQRIMLQMKLLRDAMLKYTKHAEYQFFQQVLPKKDEIEGWINKMIEGVYDEEITQNQGDSVLFTPLNKLISDIDVKVKNLIETKAHNIELAKNNRDKMKKIKEEEDRKNKELEDKEKIEKEAKDSEKVKKLKDIDQKIEEDKIALQRKKEKDLVEATKDIQNTQEREIKVDTIEDLFVEEEEKLDMVHEELKKKIIDDILDDSKEDDKNDKKAKNGRPKGSVKKVVDLLSEPLKLTDEEIKDL